MKKKFLLILFLIIIFGFILRYINITKFNIYSDSYEFMLAAKNLAKHHALDGTLGESGMYWGPLFYNRIGFAYFLTPFYLITKNLENAAHLLSFLAGILAIPAIYLAAVQIFKKREIGLIAALLLAVSFSYVMLSGFIMANTLVILFIILTLLCFFKAQEDDKQSWYILAGLLFGLTCFLRTEILITLPTFLIFILITKNHYWPKIISFFISFLITFNFLLLTLYFLLSNFFCWWQQQGSYLQNFRSRILPIFLIIILISGTLAYLVKTRKKWFLPKPLNLYTLLVLVSILIVLATPLLVSRIYNWSATWFSLRTDFLLIIAGISGLILLFKKDFTKALFSYLFLFPLLLVYFAFGGGIDFRHLNLITPLLAFLAAFFIWQTLVKLRIWLDKKKEINYKFSLISILLILGLIFYSQIYQDIKPWHSPISYEKEIGLSLKKIIEEEKISPDAILVSSFPEAHYLYTGLSTWEPRKEKPFLAKDISDDKKILLVIDEGVRDRYPNLAEIADNKLQQYALKSILSTVKYQYGQKSWLPKRLTTAYFLKAEDLLRVTE